MSGIFFSQVRTYYIRSTQQARYIQLVDTFAKVLKKGTTKKKTRYTSPLLGLPALSLQDVVTSFSNSRAPIARRANVLNKLYTKYVTDVLYTGELTDVIAEYNVQITGVRVNNDLSKMRVFWIPNGDEQDDIIEKKLEEIAPEVRHSLSRLNVIGLIPEVVFTRDKKYALAAEVDRRLALCAQDAGFSPLVPLEQRLKTDFMLSISLPENVKEGIKLLEKQEELTDEEFAPLPPMKLNTFGLDYAKMISKIRLSLKRVKTDSDRNDSNISNLDNVTSPAPMHTINPAEYVMSRKEFKKFIKKRQIEIEKMSKVRKAKVEEDMKVMDLFETDDSPPDLSEEFFIEDYYEEFDENFKAECVQ